MRKQRLLLVDKLCVQPDWPNPPPPPSTPLCRSEEKLALLRADCAALPAWHRGACNNTRLFGFNLHVKPGELTAVVDQALEVAFSSQGRPLPADLLAVAAGEGAAVPRLLAGVNDVAAEVARSPVRLAAPLLLVGAALLALTAPRLGRNTRR